MEWNDQMDRYFISLAKQGLTNKEMVPPMKRKYPIAWTVHAMRSKRGRLERRGLLERGLWRKGKEAGSKQAKENIMPKKVRKEYWTQEAAIAAVKELKAGKRVRSIAVVLKRNGLRKGFNPQAVADLLRKVRVGNIKIKDLPPAEAELKPHSPPVVKAKEEPWKNPDYKNLIVIDSQLGKERFFVDDMTLATIHDLCIRCKLGLR